MSRSVTAVVTATVREQLQQVIAASANSQLQAGVARPRLEASQAGELFAGALTSIGCRTTVREAGGLVGISAERGNQVVVALVKGGGRLAYEIGGCEGDTCQPFDHEIQQAVTQAGGALEEVESRPHRDDRGGSLIQRAARARGDRSLADGVILQEREAAPARFGHEVEKQGSAPARTAHGH